MHIFKNLFLILYLNKHNCIFYLNVIYINGLKDFFSFSFFLYRKTFFNFQEKFLCNINTVENKILIIPCYSLYIIHLKVKRSSRLGRVILLGPLTCFVNWLKWSAPNARTHIRRDALFGSQLFLRKKKNSSSLKRQN